jgi:hypothetical protein
MTRNRYSVPCEQVGQWVICEQSLRYIQPLYKIEGEVRDMEPDSRCRIQQEKVSELQSFFHFQRIKNSLEWAI